MNTNGENCTTGPLTVAQAYAARSGRRPVSVEAVPAAVEAAGAPMVLLRPRPLADLGRPGRLALAAEAARCHPIFGDAGEHDEEAWSRIVD